MAASDRVVECAMPDPRMRTSRGITYGTVRPPACRKEFQTSGKMCGLRIAHEAAETSSPAKAASLAEFAHNLCSPLSAIAMVASGLRDAETADEVGKDIDTIIRISEHALRIVRDVLDRARIEAGRDLPDGNL